MVDKTWLDTIATGLEEVVSTHSLSDQTRKSLRTVTEEESFRRLPKESGNPLVSILFLVRKATDSLLQLGACPGDPGAALVELLTGLCAVEGLAPDDQEGLELKPLDESPEPADPLGGLTYRYGAHLAQKAGKPDLAAILKYRANHVSDQHALRARLYDSILNRKPE